MFKITLQQNFYLRIMQIATWWICWIVFAVMTQHYWAVPCFVVFYGFNILKIAHEYNFEKTTG